VRHGFIHDGYRATLIPIISLPQQIGAVSPLLTAFRTDTERPDRISFGGLSAADYERRSQDRDVAVLQKKVLKFGFALMDSST
jgi:hypothetical protein